MSRPRFILLIDAQAWRLVLLRRNQFCELRTFSVEEAGRIEMLEWMQTVPGARLAVLTNLPEEHYHVETMPAARGEAGRLLLKRKLAAWPYAQGLHTTFQIDKVQTTRVENRFLFAGLFLPPLTNWLPMLEVAGLRLQGIYTQALLLPYCWPTTAQRLTDCICVQYEHATLRLSYFKHQRLFLSRHLSLPVSEMQDFQHVLPVLSQLHRELVTQFGRSESATLPVFCIASEKYHDLIPALPAPFEWQPLTEASLIQSVDQGPLPSRVSAVEWVAIHAILADLPLPNLAPETSILPDRMKRVQRSVHWTGISVCLLLAQSVVFNTLAIQHLNAQANLMSAQLKDSDHLSLANGLSAEQLPAIRALTSTVQDISTSARLPDQALQDLQPILTGVREWQLIRLEWQAEAPESMQPAAYQSQFLKMTFQRQETAHNALAVHEWQQLMHDLNQLPSVKHLQTATSAQQNMANGHQGSTDPLAMLGLQPVLTLIWVAPKQEGL